jgi:hypothetical protein
MMEVKRKKTETFSSVLVGMMFSGNRRDVPLSRGFLLVAGGCFLLRSEPLFADDAVPLPLYGPGIQYTADRVTQLPDGDTQTLKIYTDNGKIRTEDSVLGFVLVTIYRPDLKKKYLVKASAKTVIEIPYGGTTETEPLLVHIASAWELVGHETVDGVDCTKYKASNEDKRVFFMWFDSAKNIPVQFWAGDGSYSALWKNCKAGPQDAALFEPPAGYKVTTEQEPQ